MVCTEWALKEVALLVKMVELEECHQMVFGNGLHRIVLRRRPPKNRSDPFNCYRGNEIFEDEILVRRRPRKIWSDPFNCYRRNEIFEDEILVDEILVRRRPRKIWSDPFNCYRRNAIFEDEDCRQSIPRPHKTWSPANCRLHRSGILKDEICRPSSSQNVKHCYQPLASLRCFEGRNLHGR